jgi:hypothetical protein
MNFFTPVLSAQTNEGIRMTQQECDSLRARREQIVEAHIHAETSAHDIEAALATFRHPRYEVPAFDAIADGPQAVEGLLGQLLGAFPDFWLERTATHHADHAVIVNASSAALIAVSGRHRAHGKTNGSAARLRFCFRRRGPDLREGVLRPSHGSSAT